VEIQPIEVALPSLISGRLTAARGAAAAADVYVVRVGRSFGADITEHFLVGRGIELILKCFLLNAGVPNKQLGWKSFGGHDLVKLLSESEARGFTAIAAVTAHDRDVVNLLSPAYDGKILEYRDKSPIVMPDFLASRYILDAWIQAVCNLVWGATEYEASRNSPLLHQSIGLSVDPRVLQSLRE
jgi:hypothetical protein